MSATHYDGIIIGGGHNGMITAAYMAKAGLKVAVFEGRPQVGGGFATEECTAPGFKHNIHANYSKIHESPIQTDFNLDRYGISYVFPEPKKAFIRHDSYFLYYQNRERTYEEIKNVSKNDAETFRVVSEKWWKWYLDFVLPEMYSIPQRPDQWASEIAAKPGGKEYLDVVLNYSPLQYAQEVFETEYCQLAFIRGATSAEYDVNSKGISCMVFETILSWFIGQTAWVVGGIRSIPLALARVVRENGGHVFENQRVAKILIEAGAAKGVVLEDGREIHADRFIASSINPVLTFSFLIDEDKLPAKVADKVAKFKFKGSSLFRVHLALKERPRFTMGKRAPELDDAWKFTIGFETPGDFVRMTEQVISGRMPDVTGVDAGLNSIFDRTIAPAGGHVMYVGLPAPFELAEGGAGRWADIGREAGEKLLDKLREYAPNLTNDKIAGRFVYTPKDIETYLPDMIEGDICQGKICPEQVGFDRPFRGMSQYRTCFDKLYLCGASSHPGGCAHGGPGYNAALAIAADLKIKKWWPNYDPYKAVKPWER